MEKEYDQLEYIMDDLYQARALWERRGYPVTPRGTSIGEIATNAALDAYNEYQERVAEFERAFNGEN